MVLGSQKLLIDLQICFYTVGGKTISQPFFCLLTEKISKNRVKVVSITKLFVAFFNKLVLQFQNENYWLPRNCVLRSTFIVTIRLYRGSLSTRNFV